MLLILIINFKVIQIFQSEIKMVRGHSRRGNSQQITNYSKNKNKQLMDIRHQHAHSSQHTRSTALTTFRSKDREKQGLVSKISQRKNVKSKDFEKVKEVEWKQSQFPLTPLQFIKKYSHLLSLSEKAQIREYKHIYFIGRNYKMKIPEQNKNKYDEQGFYNCEVGDHIAYRYEIVQKINHGSFGEVYKVFDHKNREFQALKIVKKMPHLFKQTFVEISILMSIKQKDKDDISGIVKLKDFTIFRQHICITFELLDANLYDLMSANEFKSLSQSCVRIFAIQMLNSLNFLHRMNIVHGDIKPENFVLKQWGKSGIKLIDFGTSCYEDQQIYTYIQSRFYRAPEVIFERRYSTSIDMWSFACLIAELSLGKPLFPGNSDLHQLVYMVNLLGFPQIEHSDRCKYQIQQLKKERYLDKDQNDLLLKENMEKFQKDTGYKLDEESLRPLSNRFSQDMFPFVHFLKQILKWNPKDRITPAEALQHPWITFGLPNQIRGLSTAYQNLQKNSKKLDLSPKKAKRMKNKTKSKSKSREKNEKSPTLIKAICDKNSLQLNLNIADSQSKSKTRKYDLPQSLMSIKSKSSKRSHQKSWNEKTNKSPYSTKKFVI